MNAYFVMLLYFILRPFPKPKYLLHLLPVKHHFFNFLLTLFNFPMSAFIIDQGILNNQVAKLTLDDKGIVIKTGSSTHEILKEQIKNIELFRSIKKYCVRVATEKDIHEILNVDESYLGEFKQLVTKYFALNANVMNLESVNTTEGNLVYNNNLLTLHSSKPVFSIPKSKIEKIVEIDNELQIHLPDVEIVLSTTSNVTDFLKNKVREEICVISGLNCVNPRSKSTMIFFDTYLENRGSSYDHTIFYKHILEVLYLPTDNENYMVFKLDTPILQGQTRYESMVFNLDKKDIEVAAKDHRLKDYYRGAQDEVVIEIVEKMTGLQVKTGMFNLKATFKVYEGHLFCMKEGIQFLSKPIFIDLEDIKFVEFSRTTLSLLQAKTFDMTINTDKAIHFTTINRQYLDVLKRYFTDAKIHITTETVEEYMSDGSEEESLEEGDISDIIAESDEEY